MFINFNLSIYHSGTICVAASFPLLFINCLGCTETASELSKFIYYVPFVIIFQFGWAATQISHLALISDLSVTERDQVFLNSLRWGLMNFFCTKFLTITFLTDMQLLLLVMFVFIYLFSHSSTHLRQIYHQVNFLQYV